jgi:biotin carboxyl carrier protein
MTMPEYEVFIDDKPKKVEVTKTGQSSFSIRIDGKTRNVEFLTGTRDLEKSFTLKVDNKNYHVELPRIDRGKEFSVRVEEATFKAEVKLPARKASLTAFEPTVAAPTKRTAANRQVVEGGITAPMTGKIVKVKVKTGDEVKAGQVLCVIEAMKMENEIIAPKAGAVKEVYVSDGSSVSEGEPLLIIG